MSARIVVMGWEGRALEIGSPDAENLVKGGLCRVSLTRWGSELSDATVLLPVAPAESGAQLKAWKQITFHATSGREYRLQKAEVRHR